MTGIFSDSFLRKYWKYTVIDEDDYNCIIIGIFYRPIDFIIKLCNRIYELRLPRYDLNDIFPLDDDGFTRVTHSLLLEYGRYYADGPLLFDNIKDIKFESKIKHSLILHVNMYRSKNHIINIIAMNSGNVVRKNIKIITHWKY